MGSVRTWHWVSSAVCLVGMILFSITGITLNHAAQIKVEPTVTERSAQLPDALLAQVVQLEAPDKAPEALNTWIKQELGVHIAHANPEVSEGEWYFSLPRAGGDAWMTLSTDTGEIYYEDTDRGWISFFNDLHKGRNTGAAWVWFIDIFAVAALIFSFTGLWLLMKHAKQRPSTWPLVGFGLIAPWIMILLLMH